MARFFARLFARVGAGEVIKVQDTTRRGSLWPFRPWEVYAFLVLAVLAAVFFIVFGLLKPGDFGLVGPGVVWLLFLVFWVYRFRHVLLRRRTGSVKGGRSPSRSIAQRREAPLKGSGRHQRFPMAVQGALFSLNRAGAEI
jgi:hypothetical protein